MDSEQITQCSFVPKTCLDDYLEFDIVPDSMDEEEMAHPIRRKIETPFEWGHVSLPVLRENEVKKKPRKISLRDWVAELGIDLEEIHNLKPTPLVDAKKEADLSKKRKPCRMSDLFYEMKEE